ncbi:MAG: acetate--CoA ligase family protein [Hyphomicrobiales bacterium]|nr:acetate--CoA ligase family protein [Hyphomicrobiales bacterium]
MLDALFRPRSVAVVGASTDPSKLGSLPIKFMLGAGFAGDIYPVNPRADTIQGLKAFSSVKSIGKRIDAAIIAVPKELSLAALADCAEAGAAAAIMFTSGFAEVDAAGASAQRDIAALAKRSKMRVLGPNCLGVVNFAEGMVASFHPAFALTEKRAGVIGLASQSGAFGGLSFSLARERGLSFSYCVTTGNEADIDIAECVSFLAQDPSTEVILLYLEGCRNGPALIDALDAARRNKKRVVAIKVGRTNAGAAAAASHTATLAGSDAVFDALFRQYGVYRAETIEEFLDIGLAAALGKAPRNEKLGLVTVSGGVGVLMADAATDLGLDVTALPEATQARVREILPYAGPRNPIDVTGQVVADPKLFERGLEIALAEGGFGSLVAFTGALPRNPEHAPMLKAVYTSLRERHRDVSLISAGLSTPQFRDELAALAIPSFEDPSRAVRAAAALRFFAHRAAEPAGAEKRDLPALPSGPIGEAEALRALGKAGIPAIECHLAIDAKSAIEAARKIGFPVVMKIASPDILHKSDIGGVLLGVASEAQVEKGFEELLACARRAHPEARIQGCLIAPKIEGGTEIVLGANLDPVFGPVVMVGLGGIFVELLRDVSLRLAPVGLEEAHAMLRELKGFKLLEGARGRPSSDKEAIARAIVDLSSFALAHAHEIVSCDINPFLVLSKGAVALDAVIVRKSLPEKEEA